MSTLPTEDASASSVADSIRADIVRGRLRTGREIVIAELSEELAVSMGAVRQALLRLVEQRLVSASGDGAFHVVSASHRDLAELTALRQLVEGEAVRLSVAAGDPAWAERVRAAHDALTAAADGLEAPGLDGLWREAHAAFHEALCSGAGNERLLQLVGTLRDEAEIYRELAAARSSGRRREVDDDHRQLRDLAIAGDADVAAAALRSHLEGTRLSIESSALDDEPA